MVDLRALVASLNGAPFPKPERSTKVHLVTIEGVTVDNQFYGDVWCKARLVQGAEMTTDPDKATCRRCINARNRPTPVQRLEARRAARKVAAAKAPKAPRARVGAITYRTGRASLELIREALRASQPATVRELMAATKLSYPTVLYALREFARKVGKTDQRGTGKMPDLYEINP